MVQTDLLVVGAGPAGLSAALEAAQYGVNVTLIDESFSIGGQLRQQTQFLNSLPKQFDIQRGTTLVDEFKEKIGSSRVRFLANHTMVGAYESGHVGVSDGKKTFPIKASKVIITTGASEKAKVFSGWTRPGVMTVGAAQILMNREHVLPGKNAVIIGSNHFSLQVAKQLHDVGTNVKGIVEEESQLQCQDKVLVEEIKQANIPIFYNSSIINTVGRGKVNRVVINNNGTELEEEIDLVCIGNGVAPIIEPFEIMDCELTYRKELGGWLPKYNECFATSNSSVYVAGNAAGITCIGSIILTGKISAINALSSLERITPEQANEKTTTLWNELYELEIAEKQSVLYARCSLIEDFHKQINKPISNTVLKRCSHG